MRGLLFGARQRQIDWRSQGMATLATYLQIHEPPMILREKAANSMRTNIRERQGSSRPLCEYRHQLGAELAAERHPTFPLSDR